MDLQNQIELELYFADHFDTILFPVLADIYLDQNDLKRARKVCEIGLKHHKNDSAGLYILAQVDKQEGNLKLAEKTLEKLLLYTPDHLAAALELCEIQTVLGRATNRVLKSWKHVLSLDPNHKTAQDFVKKVGSEDIKPGEKQKPKHKTIKNPVSSTLNKYPNSLKRDTTLQKNELQDPLKVSPRLATFTLVSVLKNQGLFSQALEVLDVLEGKGENPKSIALERDTIKTLIENLKKD
ncbi:MAG: hypothetical protein CBC06_001245 [bacterium TMED46]|nr:MAG: hypothetical protein CBC06_001245 [bacterium TMED46]